MTETERALEIVKALEEDLEELRYRLEYNGEQLAYYSKTKYWGKVEFLIRHNERVAEQVEMLEAYLEIGKDEE